MEKIVFIEQGIDPEHDTFGSILEMSAKRQANVVWLLVCDANELSDMETRAKQMAAQKQEETGVQISSHVVEYTADNFISALNQFAPMDLIITGRLELEPLAEQGIKELEDISTRYKCPTLPLTALMPEKKASRTKLLMRGLIFGILSAAIYFFFFPQLDKLNHAIYMKGTILGALAVMVTVPIHAYIYGSFTEIFPRLLGLEKSAGIEH